MLGVIFGESIGVLGESCFLCVCGWCMGGVSDVFEGGMFELWDSGI